MMQSKKRFTEINIWESNWFMNLNSKQKLFWRYLNDRCDNIGIWEPNFKFAGFNMDIEENHLKEFVKHFMECMNKEQERVIILECGDWFLPDFVKFQYAQGKPLNIKNRAHVSYLNLMQDKGILHWFADNQPEILPEEILVELSKGSKRVLIDPSKGCIEKAPYREVESDKDTEKAIPINQDSPYSFERREQSKRKHSRSKFGEVYSDIINDPDTPFK